MEVTVFSRGNNTLGEAPLWHPTRRSLLWIDIVNQTLFEKTLSSTNEYHDNVWKLPEIGSAIALDEIESDHIWMVTDKSFGWFSLSSGVYHVLVKLGLNSSFRSNDGVVAPNGSFCFGTMEKKPSGLHGSVFMISPKGTLTEALPSIGIPNTFCWSNDGKHFYLSDSFRQKMFQYKVHENSGVLGNGKVLVDLSEDGKATPDGGAMDEDGNIWNCQWDGFGVVCYNKLGKTIDRIKLLIPRPTSCCFGGEDNNYLFITSAREGLDEESLSQYPLSGSVFAVKLPVKGKSVKAFSRNRS